MKPQDTAIEIESQANLMIKMAITAWKTQNDRVDKILEKLTDEQLNQEIAPGKNSGTYLLGHLAAINDNLFPLFGLGDKIRPELYKIFVESADKAEGTRASAAELRKYWKEINEKLTSKIEAFTVADWLSRHNAVSETDFAKEPHR